MLLEPREDRFFALAGLARAGRNSGSDRGKDYVVQVPNVVGPTAFQRWPHNAGLVSRPARLLNSPA
jgi:hypothetical protein